MAKHYDTAVVNFAGMKYPLKIYSGGITRQPVLAVSPHNECGEHVHSTKKSPLMLRGLFFLSIIQISRLLSTLHPDSKLNR